MQPLQFTDSMTVLGLVAMALAAFTAVYSGLAAWRERVEDWRRRAYLIGAGLGAYTAVAYAIVLFVEPLANVAWLRPAIIFWMLHYLVMMSVMKAVITTSPGERMKAENKRLEEVIKGAQSQANTWKGIVDGYKIREEKLTAEKEKMTADTKIVVQSLADVRAKLAVLAEEKIEYTAVALQQEEAINALKRQVTVMELELKKVRGRG